MLDPSIHHVEFQARWCASDWTPADSAHGGDWADYGTGGVYESGEVSGPIPLPDVTEYHEWRARFVNNVGQVGPWSDTYRMTVDKSSGINAAMVDPATVGKGLAINTAGTQLEVPAGGIDHTQIASVSAGAITGSITASQIGAVNASAITGSISASQIGAVNVSAISGQIQATQIAAVNASAISGSIAAGQIGAVNASSITGVIVTAQVADGIMSSLAKFSADLRPIKIVTSLPALPDANYPTGSSVTVTGSGKTYRNVAGAWVTGVAAGDIAGTLAASQIAAVNASAITGLIVAAQIQSIAATQITGSIQAAQIGSIAATQITGTISAAQIGSVNGANITINSISSDKIASVNAGKNDHRTTHGGYSFPQYERNHHNIDQ